MDDRVFPRGGQDLVQPVPGDLLIDRADPRDTAGRRHATPQDGRERRLVKLNDERRLRHALRDLGDMRCGALGQGGGEVRDQPGVREGQVKRARLLYRRGQRPGAGELDLQQTGVSVEDLFHRVQVGGEHRPGAVHVPARPLRDPPAARPGEFHRKVDEQRGGPTGDVRPRAASRKFRQVRQVRQLTGDDPCRLQRVLPRHRPDPGRGPRCPRKR